MSKKGQSFVKPPSEDSPRARRNQVKERLEHNLKSLSSLCQSGANNFWDWPSYELLMEIRQGVFFLAGLDNKRQIWRHDWKEFKYVDKRMKKLQLESRVTDLINRARKILRSESELSKDIKATMEGDEVAKSSLRDLALHPKKFARLLDDDRIMVQQWCMAQPLMKWAYEIKHPVVEDLPRLKRLMEQAKAVHRKYQQRERVRRLREKQRQKA